MKTTTVSTYEAKLYIGSRLKYDGPEFTRADIVWAVQRYGTRVGVIPVRITSTCYVANDYLENGFEIAVINYPRHPREKEELEQFMRGLAEELLERFQQNRISVVFPDVTVMIEADDASTRTHH